MTGLADGAIDIGLLDEAGIASQCFQAGEKIFIADDDADCMYVVKSGVVELTAYGAVLDRVAAGGIFGEVALIDGETRTATATAAQRTEVVPVSRDAFLDLVRREPTFALDVMQTLARRLRGMNENL